MGGNTRVERGVGLLKGSGLVHAAEENLPLNPNRNRGIRWLLGSAAVSLALVASGANISEANAAGPVNLAFDGGTPAQRATVRDALDASKFDWSILWAGVIVHIKRNLPDSLETQGRNIWIDPGLLDAEKDAWGPVEHEFAHEVDYQVLTDPDRQKLWQLLGGSAIAWCPSDNAVPKVPHSNRACERFASMVAWSYWQSPDNTMQPSSKNDESAAAPPAQFRNLLNKLLKVHRLSELSPNTQLATVQSYGTTGPNGGINSHLRRLGDEN